MKNTALVTASLIFAIVTVIHILRYMNGWEVIIAHQNIPLQASIYGGAISAILAIWMFVAALRKY